MAQVVEERENSSTRMSNFPRDLLKRFMSVNHHHPHHNNRELQQQQHRHGDGDAEQEQEIELSLGLSMNGRFGVDPTAKKIKRTTSIPEFSFSKPLRDEDNNNNNNSNQDIGGYSNNMPMPCTTNLIRTCSLPTETEEEWRKRKELQTLRRLEARRKRSEKQQRNMKAMREKSNRSSSSSSFSEDIVGFVDGNNSNLVEAALNEFSSLGRTTSLSTRVGELGLNGEKKSGGGCGCGGLPLPSPPPSRGPFGSPQGAGSSGISESESPQGQGSRPGDAISPVGSDTFSTTTRDESSNKHSPRANKTKEIVKSLLEDMPCVSTKFDGPNGKKIEGFLYRYGKGLEVRIVCVCHGSFLTPAEFVKHGGGGDVSNPLKHIVVSPGGCL